MAITALMTDKNVDDKKVELIHSLFQIMILDHVPSFLL